MKSWPETVKLSAPVRDVRLADASRTSLDAPLRAAWQAGYDQGRVDGEKSLGEQLMKQRSELNQLLHGTLDSIRQAVPQVIHDTENVMVTLALEVARKLVSDMPISVEMVEAAVRDALGHVEGSAQITIRLHAADLELLRNAGSPLLTSGAGPNEFRFLSSSEVSRGGCMIETRFGTVDSRRETKFDLVKKAVSS
jgi:flagellar assembly protein FliH